MLQQSCASETQHMLSVVSFVEFLRRQRLNVRFLFQSRATWHPTSTRAAWCSRTCRWPSVCRRRRTSGPKPRARDSIATCESPQTHHPKIKPDSSRLERKVVLSPDLPKLLAGSDAAEPVGKSCLFLLSVVLSLSVLDSSCCPSNVDIASRTETQYVGLVRLRLLSGLVSSRSAPWQ